MLTAIKRSTRTGEFRRSWSPPHRLTAGLLALLCAGAVLGNAATAFAAKPARPSAHGGSGQQLAVLDYGHQAYQAPRTTAGLDASVPAQRPITGARTTLPVVGHATTRQGQHWLKVMLPGRPNSSTGWIKRAGTEKIFTHWSIRISTGSRRLWVYYAGRIANTFSVVVGKPSSPTPTGTFFVEEAVIMPVSEPGGPYALALSARSNVFSEFDGGPGQIGIHGRDGLGGTLGQAESHGCIRLATPDIDWLVSRIGPGTRVTIS